MRVTRKTPEPGDTVLCGKYSSKAYIGVVDFVRDGYVVMVDKSLYPHDLQNVWVLED